MTSDGVEFMTNNSGHQYRRLHQSTNKTGCRYVCYRDTQNRRCAIVVDRVSKTQNKISNTQNAINTTQQQINTTQQMLIETINKLIDTIAEQK
jgi:hypothetical protein